MRAAVAGFQTERADPRWKRSKASLGLSARRLSDAEVARQPTFEYSRRTPPAGGPLPHNVQSTNGRYLRANRTTSRSFGPLLDALAGMSLTVSP
jgi:hypothetical protein